MSDRPNILTKENGRKLLEAYRKINLYGEVTCKPFTSEEHVLIYCIAKELIEKGTDDEN